jgi:hypothetical protein
VALTEDSIRETARSWQEVLELRDWDLRIEVVRGDWRKSGDIKIDACNRLAVLMVSEAVEPEHLDEVVLHELVHLRLHALDRMLEDLLSAVYGDADDDPRRDFAHGQFMDNLETTTQGVTRALLTLAGRGDVMITPFLAHAVKEALDPD